MRQAEAKWRALGGPKGEDESGDRDKKESKSCEWSRPSDPEALVLGEVGIRRGVSAHRDQGDGRIDAGEFTTGEGVAEFVDEDGDKDHGH